VSSRFHLCAHHSALCLPRRKGRGKEAARRGKVLVEAGIRYDCGRFAFIEAL